MINTITNGPGVNVIAGHFHPPWIDMTRTSAGIVRYNNNNFEVYDGISLIIMSSGMVQVSLDGVTLESLQWVRRKMTEEKQLEELAKNNSTVADALMARDRAEDALEITVALCSTK